MIVGNKTFHITLPSGEQIGALEVIAYGAPDENNQMLEREMTRDDWCFIRQIADRMLAEGATIQ